jgi:hypothetical protein
MQGIQLEDLARLHFDALTSHAQVESQWKTLEANTQAALVKWAAEPSVTDGYRPVVLMTIVGASLQVSPPWGQYDPDRIVNIGQNRWTVKGEVGVSKAMGSWTWELQAAGTFFSDNDDFFGGNERSQDAIWSLQGHAIHSFASGQWLSLDATYFTGGTTTINDDAPGDDLQRNWRVGAILAIPVNRRHSLKLSASSGLWARTGNSFDAFGVAWQYRWGGGL